MASATKDAKANGAPAVRDQWDDDALAQLMDRIETVEVECVIGNPPTLQRIKFGAGTDPAMVGPFLKSVDPNCKVRDDFPKAGKWGGKDNKRALVKQVLIRGSENGLFVDLVCQNGGEDDIGIGVPKKKCATFIQDIRALSRLSDKTMEKIEKAGNGKVLIPVEIPEAERFGVTYWTADDGKHLVANEDSYQAEPPAPAAKEGGES